jgi:hypothetical protein
MVMWLRPDWLVHPTKPLRVDSARELLPEGTPAA